MKNRKKTQENEKKSYTDSVKDDSDESRPVAQLFEQQDPLTIIMNGVEKRIRNLEKKRVKMAQLQQMIDEGKTLNEDQRASASKLEAVVVSLESMRETVSYISSVSRDYKEWLASKVVKPVNGSKAVASVATSNETVKRTLLVLNNVKRLEEARSNVTSFDCDDERVLSLKEADMVIKFVKISLLMSRSETPSKLKKNTHAMQMLLDGDQKIIGKEMGITYADLMALIEKIPRTITKWNSSDDSQKSSKEKANEPISSSSAGFKPLDSSNEQSPVGNGDLNPVLPQPASPVPQTSDVPPGDGWIKCYRGASNEKKKDGPVKSSKARVLNQSAVVRTNKKQDQVKVVQLNGQRMPEATIRPAKPSSIVVVVTDVTESYRKVLEGRKPSDRPMHFVRTTNNVVRDVFNGVGPEVVSSG